MRLLFTRGIIVGIKPTKRAVNRISHAHQRPRLKSGIIRTYVEESLAIGWSPEQIAGRISIDHPELSISHEAIYQYIYEEHP